MEENKRNIWNKYLKNTLCIREGYGIFRKEIYFSGKFYKNNPIYTLDWIDNMDGDTMDIISLYIHDKKIYKIDKINNTIKITYDHNCIVELYLKEVNLGLKFLKFPYIDYEKNFLAFMLLCFNNYKVNLPLEMIIMILSYIRRFDIIEKDSFRKKGILEKSYNYFLSIFL